MIDVGNGTGFSRETSDSNFMAAGQPGAPGGLRHVAAPAVIVDAPPFSPKPEAAGQFDHVLRPGAAGPARGPIAEDRDGIQAGNRTVFRNNPAVPDFAALQALAGAGTGDQAAAIARQVADMAQGLAALADKLVGQPQPAANDMAEADCVAFIESQFRIRRLRGRHLAGLSLGEPAWDILLDLTIAQYWRRETSVTSLCIAADVPSTTALRWISGMTKAGLIVRRSCHRDGRRSFLAIAPEPNLAMLALAADALRTEVRVRARYQRAAAG